MILFVSGRCDIPAFYSSWFYQRLKEGFVDVRNPFNDHQISRIILDEKHIDAILFCTKNPIPMMERLSEIKNIPYVFHITFTPYKEDIEQITNKKDIIQAIIHLSKQIGKERVIVRYDPIILSKTYTLAYHKKAFEKLCSILSEYVDKIIISFVDMYKNTKENSYVMGLKEISEVDMRAVGQVLGDIGKRYHIQLQTCAEEVDLSDFGITKGLCINRSDIEKLIGHPLILDNKKGVRKSCNCLPTVDIGDYNCCAHSCLYCYANYDAKQIKERMLTHDPNSSVLLGQLSERDHICIREDKKKVQNISLFEE